MGEQHVEAEGTWSFSTSIIFVYIYIHENVTDHNDYGRVFCLFSDLSHRSKL